MAHFLRMERGCKGFSCLKVYLIYFQCNNLIFSLFESPENIEVGDEVALRRDELLPRGQGFVSFASRSQENRLIAVQQRHNRDDLLAK